MDEMEGMEKVDFDMVAHIQTTARNFYELMLQLAERIRQLEAENAELRNKLGS